MKDKEKILILYPGSHLAYSPSILNLYDCLLPYFEVTIVSLPPAIWSDQKVSDRNVSYIQYKKVSNVHFKLVYFFKKIFDSKWQLSYNDYVFIRYLNKTVSSEYTHVIAVDTSSLLATQLSTFKNQKVHFLSLEIYDKDQFLPCIDFSRIESILIQSKVRLEYYVKDRHQKYFIVPNAPIYKKLEKAENKLEDILYCGTVTDYFGFYSILNFLKTYQDYKLTVKGAVNKENRDKIALEYGDLLKENRLTIDSSYASEEDILDYIKNYKIGVCFYDIRYENINKFNYYTAPSGKLFKYLAAGIPVIVNNLIGLTEVLDRFQVGAVVNDLEPESIYKAILSINNNYEEWSANCMVAAQHYDFKKAIDVFIEDYK